MSGVQADLRAVRADVARLHAELVRYNLVAWTSGNVSARVPGGDLMVIKASGIDYDEITADQMIVCDLYGNAVAGELSPSSDTAAHAYVYRHMPSVGGVVHTHSTYACAWAARGEPIPCVLTAMADEFGGPIPVGPFALIGDDDIGASARAAVQAAVMCEDVARSVHLARQAGEPIPISEDDIDRLYARYQTVYGQR